MQISSRAVMFWGCRWATRTFNSLQRFSMGLRSGDWLGHSRTLKCFLRSHSFVARAVCLGSLSCWKTQPRFIFNALADGRRFSLKISRYIHSFLYTDQSSWSLCRKTAPKHDVSTPMLHSRYGVLWMQLSILSPPNTTSWVFTKKFYFGFIWPYDILPILFWIIQMLSSKLQTGWTCTGLSRGTRLAWCSVLLMVAFVTLVPALCRSFTRSPRVVLGFLLTVLVIILTPRGEILRGAPDRGRLSVVLYVFHFLIIAPTVDFFTPSCLPIADSVFPAWCRSTILFLVSFDSSLVLAIVEFGVWLFEVVDRCLLYW